MAKNNNEVTGWVGWIGFASFMLYLAGFFSIVAGLVALFTDKVYVIGEQAIWVLDYTQWGWIHIIVGALALIAGGSLMQGKGFGRTIAVLIAFVSAVANMLFIPIYPIWAILVIVIDVLIIYAVIVHGKEVKDLQ
jgi:hypothetical protein